MKSIYLAGPMTGYPNGNKAAFDAAAAKLRSMGHFVFSPAEAAPPDGKPTPEAYRRYLALDFTWISLHADTMAFLPGWEASRGANAERALATALGLDLVDAETFERSVARDAPKKQTSPHVSSIAGKILKMTEFELHAHVSHNLKALDEIRALAASALGQDETA